MEKLRLTLTNPERRFVREQAVKGGFVSVNEYVRQVIRKERDQVAQRHVSAD